MLVTAGGRVREMASKSLDAKSFDLFSRFGLPIAFGTWILSVLAGICLLTKYATTPGKAVHLTAAIKVIDPTLMTPGIASLLMFVHPKCPCSRASLEELQVLMTHCKGRLKAEVEFADFKGVETQTDLWKTASEIDGVRCEIDHSNLLATRLHAGTSGQVFVYDSHGKLRFSGGLTQSRGHVGDSTGLMSIENIVDGTGPVISESPVYGCSLH